MSRKTRRSRDGEAPRVGDVVEARVRALDENARGIGATDDGVEVRIPGVLAGEKVRGEVEHVDKHRRRHARLLEVLEPSPDRVDLDRAHRNCGHFLDCGGCDFLHATIDAQHRYKRSLVAEALSLPLDRVDPLIASPRELGYRALAKLVIGPGREVGSYRPRSHEVIDMRGCVVHAPEAEAIAESIRQLIRRPLEAVPIRYALIRASLDEKKALVTIVVRSRADAEAPSLRGLISVLSARSDVGAVTLHVNDSTGDELLSDAPHDVVATKGPLFERLGESVHAILPGAFSQVNPLAAARLYEAVVRLVEPAERCVLDLYSGSGGIAIALARAGAASVIAVEANARAAEAGRASLEANGLAGSVRFLASSVEEALGSVAERAEAIVLNPPRKGASAEAVEGIVHLRPKRIVYVSCDPHTLARDARAIEGGGFKTVRVAPVDLFPHTRHVETVVRFDLP
jgi:23S rRNA (uracil1939-C5)-methyltransferase